MTAPANTLRLCIATGRYLRAGETFVTRHAAHLFGGNTVVVCGRPDAPDPAGRPVFVRRTAAMNPADLLAAPVALWRNLARYDAPFVPYGRQARALEAFLRAERVEAILAEFGSQAVSLWPVAKALGLPIFAYFRGRDASLYLQRPRRVAGYRRMMPALAGVFAVSRFLLGNLAAKGLEHPNAHVVPSGVDLAAFRPGAKEPGLMLAVGRLVEKKAPLVTLDAFAAVATRHPAARLEVIGDGPLLRVCRARAAAAGLGARVTFHGRQPHAFVRDRLAAADIFVQHSVTGRDGETEGMPSSIQEAMAAGAAILSTRHAGIPEFVAEGETGFLAAEHDRAGFAAGLEALLADPARTRAMGVAARRVAEERFDQDTLFAQVEAVIRAGIEARR